MAEPPRGDDDGDGREPDREQGHGGDAAEGSGLGGGSEARGELPEAGPPEGSGEREAEEAAGGEEGGEEADGVPAGQELPAEAPDTKFQDAQDAIEETYGEWVSGTKDKPGNVKVNLWRRGMVIEAIVRDYAGEDQGSVIIYVITEAKGFGTFRCKCVAIQDQYFLWWMRDNAGHPDPGLWRPVFLPFDLAAGENESPPAVEVGNYRILSKGEFDDALSLLGVKWL